MALQKNVKLKPSKTSFRPKGSSSFSPLKAFFFRIVKKPRFSSLLLKQKFISRFLRAGKKQSLDILLRSVFRKIALRKYSPRTVFTMAIFNVKPVLEARRLQTRGKTSHVPTPISFDRQIYIALRTISNCLLSSKTLENAIVHELFDSFFLKSSSVKFARKSEKIVLRNRLNLKYRF